MNNEELDIHWNLCSVCLIVRCQFSLYLSWIYIEYLIHLVTA